MANWPLILFVWVNLAAIVGLILALAFRGEQSAKEATESVKSLLDQYRQAADHTRAESTQTTNLLISQFGRMLEHGAAMHQGQARTSNLALTVLATSQNKYALKILQTFLVAQKATMHPAVNPSAESDLSEVLSRISGEDNGVDDVIQESLRQAREETRAPVAMR